MAFTAIANKTEKKSKKQKQKHPNDQTTKTTSGSPAGKSAFKPSSEVKGLKFGAQFIVKSFTIRRASPLEVLKLLSLPPQQTPRSHPPPPSTAGAIYNSTAATSTATAKPPFPSTIAFIPTNFTILAHDAWHTLTLGLGTKKSKVVILVFESESMKRFVDRIWPTEIPLGEVNKKMLRGLSGCELARFKFRKGCVTFYVYAVRTEGVSGFGGVCDLEEILSSVVALKDFMDHTAMLALPNQRSITSYGGATTNSDRHHRHQYSVAMAH